MPCLYSLTRRTENKAAAEAGAEGGEFVSRMNSPGVRATVADHAW